MTRNATTSLMNRLVSDPRNGETATPVGRTAWGGEFRATAEGGRQVGDEQGHRERAVAPGEESAGTLGDRDRVGGADRVRYEIVLLPHHEVPEASTGTSTA